MSEFTDYASNLRNWGHDLLVDLGLAASHIDVLTQLLDAERALADDFADVLIALMDDFALTPGPEVVRVLARYRKARGL